MGKKRTGLTVLLVFIAIAVFSQHKDTLKARINHYSFTVGTGWSHYFNNLEYGDNNIRQDFAGLSCRFYWEPEYRLSLGLESGYFRLFRVKNQITPDIGSEVDRSVIPLLLLVRMRVVDNVYLSTGLGLAVLTNKAAAGDQKIITKTWSLSNYEVAASYIYPLKKHLRVGGEMKLYNFGVLNDWMFALQAFVSVRL
ncbi:MAG: hypothetical protein WCO44_08085 [Bacteroidota bacterium]